MRRWQTGAGALTFAILITTTSTAAVPRPIEPVAQASFAPVPTPTAEPVIPRLVETRPRSIQTPPPDRTVEPKPKVRGTPRPVPVDQVTGRRWGVKEGARAAKAYARSRLNVTQFGCLEDLWRHESGWRWNALNSSSGAYGIPQALPGSKMRSAGSDWRTNPITQVRWGLGYVSGRYGTACAAWSHFKSHGWY